MAMLQLNPPLPMNTPKGEGLAHLLIDYGPESDLYWTVFLATTGEIWTFANRHVRAAKNITLDRTHPGQPAAESQGPIARPMGRKRIQFAKVSGALRHGHRGGHWAFKLS